MLLSQNLIKMKKLILITSSLLTMTSLSFSKPLEPQQLPFNQHTLCKLQSSGLSEPSYIGPRDYSETRKLMLHSLDRPISSLEMPHLAKAVFEISFGEGVSEETKTAATYAANLWSEILTTDQTIVVWVFEEADESANTLASASAYDYVLDLATSYTPLHYNPVVISNRKYNTDWMPGSPDIVVNVNANQEFYYGVDGKCPADKHDLVTILLHELGHGLGFYDSVSGETNYKTDSFARFGLSGGVAFAYDYFLTDGTGLPILSDIAALEDNNLLYTRVTSGNVYFQGPLTKALTNTTGAKMFAPITWSDGSSISHLDESTYVLGNENSLMTPTASKAEVVHDPGPIAIALLGDIGWDHVWLQHTKVADTEDPNALLSFDVSIRADAPLSAPPTVYYRTKGSIDLGFQALPMASTLEPGVFTIPFQLTGIATKYEYYIGVAASSNRQFTYPAMGADSPITLNIGPDDVPPVLTHTPSAYQYSHRIIFTAEVQAIDNIAMGGVNAEVWMDGVPVGTFPAELQPSGNWVALVAMPDMTDKTAIQYCFWGYDASAAQNTTRYPAEGTFSLPIEQIYTPASVYVNDLSNGDGDFILDGFEVKTLAGFTTASLGTPHPYQNNGDQIDYYAYLRQPILVQAGMKLTFDEIVLVEPGKEGSAFPSRDFFDYVSVEVSTDRGRTWNPLLGGWDSTASVTWQVPFTNGIGDGAQDSTAVGIQSMFIKHTMLFDESEFVTPGNEAMLRFHLYSDPFAVGWGWEIDNIVIGQ